MFKVSKLKTKHAWLFGSLSHKTETTISFTLTSEVICVIRYVENRIARSVVRGVAKASSLLGLCVRQDRHGYDRYFISTKNKEYIVSYRKKKRRVGTKKALTRMEKYEQTDNPFAVLTDYKDDTFNEYHLGYLSFYREANTGRYMWDTPQRDMG